MPIYQYECRKCQHEFETQQSFSEESLSKCPYCSENALFRVVSGGAGFFLAGRTIGVLADRNDAKFSSDFKDSQKKKSTQKADTLSPHLQDGASISKPKVSEKKPWYLKNQKVSDAKLKAATPEQQKNYIEKGHL